MSPRLHPPAAHSPLAATRFSSHSGTQPPTQHSAFFSTTYAVPILQVLLFDIHPSNGGGVPPLLALPLIANPPQRPRSRLPPRPTTHSAPPPPPPYPHPPPP